MRTNSLPLLALDRGGSEDQGSDQGKARADRLQLSLPPSLASKLTLLSCFRFRQKNIRRASITIDAILKLKPSLSSSGPVVKIGDDEAPKSKEQTTLDTFRAKVKAKKERRKSLSDMCKVGPRVEMAGLEPRKTKSSARDLTAL